MGAPKMPMNEQALQAKIIKYLESKGAFVVKTISTNKTGCPDLLVCYKSIFVGIEVKAPGKLGNLTKIQEAQLEKIKEAGGNAYVVDSLESVKEIVK